MAIMMRALKILDNSIVFPGYFLYRWDIDQQFSFDIDIPENWKKFIIKNGIHRHWRQLAIRWIREHQRLGEKRPLPKDDGLPVAFMVYTWGAIKGVSRKEFYLNLFPGQDPQAGKTRDLVMFGRIV